MGSSYFIKVIITLALLLAILFVLQKMAKKLYKIKYKGEIKILDRQPVDTHSAVVLLEVKQHHFLVGVSGKGMSLLHKFGKGELTGLENLENPFSELRQTI